MTSSAGSNGQSLSFDSLNAARQAVLLQLTDRANELNNSIRRTRDQLHQLHERSQMFVPTKLLSAKEDDDAADVKRLEEEVESKEEELWEAALTRKTYELISKRLRGQGQEYARNLEAIDHHAKAKEKDATELALMLKDACDVRDAARAELAKASEKKAERLRQAIPLLLSCLIFPSHFSHTSLPSLLTGVTPLLPPCLIYPHTYVLLAFLTSLPPSPLSRINLLFPSSSQPPASASLPPCLV